MRAALFATWLVWAAAGPACAQGRPAQFAVVPPKLPAGGRLMAFDLRIKGGRVSAFRTVPAGWTVTIDNDPSWNGSVAGQAVVGAAALEGSDLATMFTVSPPPPAAGGQTPSLSGSITAMVDGDQQTRAFPSIQLRRMSPLP